MVSIHPKDLPKNIKCNDCGETTKIYDNYLETEAKPHFPSSSRKKLVYYCNCGYRLCDILDENDPRV